MIKSALEVFTSRKPPLKLDRIKLMKLYYYLGLTITLLSVYACGSSRYISPKSPENMTKTNLSGFITGFKASELIKEPNSTFQLVYSGSKSLPKEFEQSIRLNWLDFTYSKTVANNQNIKWMLNDPQAIQEKLKKLGLKKDLPTIVFGDSITSNFLFTSGWGEEGRIAWMLEVLGFSNVALVDGGLKALIDKSKRNSLSKNSISLTKTDPFKGKPLLTYKDLKLALTQSPDNFVFLDTRSRDEFEGKKAHVPIKGSIKGAKNLHVDLFFDKDGYIKDQESTKQSLKEIGISGDKTVVTYCSGGVRSAMVYYILKHQLGFPSVYNYDGSWAEWSVLSKP